MAIDSDSTENGRFEAVVSEYDGLSAEEIKMLEHRALRYFRRRESALGMQPDEVQAAIAELDESFGSTNREVALDRVDAYLCGQLKPLINVGLDKVDENNLLETERSINDAIDYVKRSSEEFDPILDDLFEALNTLQRLENEAKRTF